MLLSSGLTTGYGTVPAQDVDVESVLRSACCETQAHTMHGSLNEGILGFCAPCRVQHGQSGPKWAAQESAIVSIIGALSLLVPIDTNKARLQRLELVPSFVTLATQALVSALRNAQSTLGIAATSLHPCDITDPAT